MTLEVSGRRLLEVAVALPVPGTFTYRDPRPGAAAPVGAQVVVPFGARTVTGFVVGRAARGARRARRRRATSRRWSAGEPAFDEAMIAFCRWAADYYQAPLGEVLRAALPQGEQASATRAVRLTDARAGERERRAAGSAARRTRRATRCWRALADAGGELPLQRASSRLVPRARPASCRGWPRRGWSRWATRCSDRRPPPTVALAFARSGATAAALPKRARGAERALLAKLAAAADGLPVAALSAAERTHAARAVDGGAGARRAPAGRANAPAAPRAPRAPAASR